MLKKVKKRPKKRVFFHFFHFFSRFPCLFPSKVQKSGFFWNRSPRPKTAEKRPVFAPLFPERRALRRKTEKKTPKTWTTPRPRDHFFRVYRSNPWILARNAKIQTLICKKRDFQEMGTFFHFFIEIIDNLSIIYRFFR